MDPTQDPLLEDPTNLQLSPLPADPGAAAGAASGMGVAPSGKPWAQNQQTGAPITQKVGNTVYQYDTDGNPWPQIQGSPAPTSVSTRLQPVPRSGTFIDPITRQPVYAGGAYGGFYNPTTVINPGQKAIGRTGEQLGQNPLYDPQQFGLLAREANRQYQLGIMQAQQKWQQDRDTQKFRQATLAAENEYKQQLLGIQRATLAASTAVQARQMGQPFAVQLQDGRTAFVSPNEMVGGVSNDWQKYLGQPNQPINTQTITGQDAQELPDIAGVNDALPGPSGPTTAGPAADLTPPAQGSGLEQPIDYDTPWGTQASNAMNIGGWNTPMPAKPSGLEQPMDLDTPWGTQANKSMGIGGWGPDALPGAPQPDTGEGAPTPPLGAGNPLSGLAPPDLSGLSGKSGADIVGMLGGLGGSAADILGGRGGPFAPAHPAPAGVMPGGAMPGQFTPGASDTSNAGRSTNPIGGRSSAPSGNPSGFLQGLNLQGLNLQGLNVTPTQQQNADLIQELQQGGGPGALGSGNPFDSLNGLNLNGLNLQGLNFGGGGGDVGKGQAALRRIGAGPNLGQPMQPPGGGVIPPVPPDQIVGQGHMFGTPTSDEKPYHKGVDFQAVQGVPAIAPVAGTVISVGDRGELGLSVTIQDDQGQIHELNHLSAIGVQKGSQVMAGDMVGKVGSSGNSTGPHLDYRVRGQGGDFANPMTNPSIAGALQGLPDMSGAPPRVGSGQGEEEEEQSGNAPEESTDSGWDPGSQYNEQTDSGWQQVTVGNDGGYSTSAIDPSQYSNYGIPGGNQGGGGLPSNFYENPSPGGGFSSEAPGLDESTGYQGYDYSNPSNPANPANPASPTGPGAPTPGQPTPGSPRGLQIPPWDPTRYNTMLGGSKDLLQMQLSASAAQQHAQIDADKETQIRQLDAQYKTAMLSATTQKEMQAIQIAYQDRRDQLEQQTEYKKLEVQQAMAKELEASQERIAGTQARSNVLSTWGRSAAASPWLARLSGRTPTPGDIGSGTGYGTQSVNTQNLLSGGATPGGSYLGYVNPGNGAAPTPQAPVYGGAQQGWQGATSGGGDYPSLGKGQGDAGQGDIGQAGFENEGSPANSWGDANGNRLAYSIFGSGQGDQYGTEPVQDTSQAPTSFADRDYSAASMGDRGAAADVPSGQASAGPIYGDPGYGTGAPDAQSSYRPYGMDWGGGSSQGAPSMPTWSAVGGMQNPQPGGSAGSAGNWWDAAQQAGWSAPSTWQQPTQGTPQMPSWSQAGGMQNPQPQQPASQGGFANNIDDLTQGGPMPTAPSVQDWESLGPFGQASMRYGLESAGYNWAPYSEAMLAGWRQSGQNDPNTGLSGWGAPHVTNLGMQSMSPIQQQGLQQTAELFSPYSDYLNREARSWQTGARPMTNVRA